MTWKWLSLLFFFGLFPIWGRLIEFSISTFFILSLLVSHSCIFLWHHSTSVSVFLSFGLYPLPSSVFPLLHLLLQSSLHHLNILISVLSCQFCSSILSAQVSLPYIRTGLVTIVFTAAFSIITLFLTFLATYPNQLPLDVSYTRDRKPMGSFQLSSRQSEERQHRAATMATLQRRRSRTAR